MRLHKTLDQGEPQAGALGLARGFTFCSIEGLKEVTLLGVGNAGAVILYLQNDVFAPGHRAHAQRLVLCVFGILHGIVHEIDQDLCDSILVK